jgi:hypothetical protein
VSKFINYQFFIIEELKTMITAQDYQQELITLLLSPETPYPWNPSDLEAEDYLTERDKELRLIDTLDDFVCPDLRAFNEKAGF